VSAEGRRGFGGGGDSDVESFTSGGHLQEDDVFEQEPTGTSRSPAFTDRSHHENSDPEANRGSQSSSQDKFHRKSQQAAQKLALARAARDQADLEYHIWRSEYIRVGLSSARDSVLVRMMKQGLILIRDTGVYGEIEIGRRPKRKGS
jgi:hypothetical protein